MIPAALPELAGRLHPALVHLPIGFLLLLALAELAGWLRPAIRPPLALRTFALGASLAAACAAAACGWWLGRQGDYEAALLERHRWAGVACTVLTAALLILRRRPLPYALTFAGCLVALGAAGHLGGTLTHGEGYLWRADPPAPAPRAAVTSAADARVFEDLIQPVLEQRCVACHGAAKSNGGLRYDSAAAALRGGKSGPLLPPGRPAESLMLRRLRLPLEAKEHMPPKGKPQPSAAELELLEWWILAGAPVTGTLAAQGAPPAVLEAAAARLVLPPPALPERAALAARARELETRLGIVVRPLAQDGPWLEANARLRGARFTDADLHALAPVADGLVRLDLGGTGITDAGLAALPAMTRLQRLHLDHTKVTAAGLEHLSGLSRLETLNLAGTPVGDEAVPLLGRLPALRSLYAWNTLLTEPALAGLTRARDQSRRVQQLRREVAEAEAKLRAESFTLHRGAEPPAPAVPPPNPP